MDRSTEITLRSAIIIASMILVPLWAVLGTSWTSGVPKDHVAEKTVRSKTRTSKAATEAKRELTPPLVLAANDPPRAPQTDVPSPVVPASVPPVASNLPPPAQPVVTPPASNAPPAVQVAPPVSPTKPMIQIRSFDGQALPDTPEPASRIASDAAQMAPTVQPTVATSTAVQHTLNAVPVDPTPALVTPGDWFQWTETKLRELGATQFILESNGEQGYRFRCKAPLPTDPGFARHFEATGETALAAMQDAMRQIDAWRRNVR